MIDSQIDNLQGIDAEKITLHEPMWSWSILLGKLESVPGVVWTMLSMALSISIYSRKLGWMLAAGLMGLLLIHECGHILAASFLRISTSAPIFIPYIGAVIDLKSKGNNRWDLALVGIAGPIAGTIATLGCFTAYKVTGSVILATLGAAGCIQNLFNLIPMGSLDGGHIVGAIARWIWIPGYLLMFCLAWFVRSPVIWISLLVMLPQVIGIFKPISRSGSNYRRPSFLRRFMLGSAYVGLVLLLSVMLLQLAPTGIGYPQHFSESNPLVTSSSIR